MLVALVAMFLLVGCAGKPNTPRAVTVAMGFIPNVQFTPMYVALEKGYFAAEGVQLTLDYGMETDLLQRVGSGQIPFALASGDQVILARAGGLPVKYVLNWYRRFPVCVVSLAEKGITDPKHLVGKKVGISHAAGASYIGWQAFLDQVGVAPKDVNLQVIGYTQVASLVEGRVDAAVCYAVNEPVQMIASGYKINVFYLDRYTHLVSNGLVTNEETIKKDPKLVQGVMRAFLRGLQDTIQDPEAAFAITRKAIPEMDDASAKLQRAVLQECVTFWSGENLGASSPQDWEESVASLKKFGVLTAEVKPDTLYTNAYLSK
jgi:NitT/TauT family transport system substrate-binding protein